MFCNADKNYVRVEVSDADTDSNPVVLGYVSECEIDEDNEITKTKTFDGIVTDSWKYPEITISLTRLIRYEMTTESTIRRVLNCMLTDPKTITFISQHTEGTGSGLVGRNVERYRNCRLANRKRRFKPDEEFNMELEFSSEGLIDSDSDPVWSYAED